MLRDHLSFLTKIPTGKHGDFERIAETQYLFPITGLIIGLVMYLFSFVLVLTSLPIDLLSLLLISFLYSLTGILHLDGLSDFFDGLVKPGKKFEKIEAMKDPALGILGALSAFIVILLLFTEFKTILSHNIDIELFISRWINLNIPETPLLIPLISGEVSAKLSMNTCTMFSDPIDKGMGKYFMDRISEKDYLISVFLTMIILGALNPILIVVGLISQVVPLLLIKISRRNYGGENGDVIGSSNELTRAFTLLLIILLGGL